MYIRIRRFTKRQFQSRDSEGPDICFMIVTRLLDDFGCHPKRGAYEGILLRHRGGELSRDAEICEFDLSI